MNVYKRGGIIFMTFKTHNYPSDISFVQFSLVASELDSLKKKTKPKTVRPYDVFCAICYVLKGGIQWRMLPSDFPNWNTVYYYYRMWTKVDESGTSAFERLLQKIVRLLRFDALKLESPSVCIIDSKSVKNADTAQKKGYDGGKKVSGIKVHAATDSLGLPHMIYVTTANVMDRDGAIEMLSNYINKLSKIEKFLVDKGYSGDNFANAVKELCDASIEVSTQKKKTYFVPEGNRWVVERSFGWLSKARRLVRNYEGTCEATRQMTIFAFLVLLLRRF